MKQSIAAAAPDGPRPAHRRAASDHRTAEAAPAWYGSRQNCRIHGIIR